MLERRSTSFQSDNRGKERVTYFRIRIRADKIHIAQTDMSGSRAAENIFWLVTKLSGCEIGS